jgi:hypothetical protein
MDDNPNIDDSSAKIDEAKVKVQECEIEMQRLKSKIRALGTEGGDPNSLEFSVIKVSGKFTRCASAEVKNFND